MLQHTNFADRWAKQWLSLEKAIVQLVVSWFLCNFAFIQFKESPFCFHLHSEQLLCLGKAISTNCGCVVDSNTSALHLNRNTSSVMTPTKHFTFVQHNKMIRVAIIVTGVTRLFPISFVSAKKSSFSLCTRGSLGTKQRWCSFLMIIN